MINRNPSGSTGYTKRYHVILFLLSETSDRTLSHLSHLPLCLCPSRQGLADYLEGYHNQVNVCLQNEVHVVPVQVRIVKNNHPFRPLTNMWSAALCICSVSFDSEHPVQDGGPGGADGEEPVLRSG